MQEISSPPQRSVLMEESVQIAWDYLERADKIDDGRFCSRILADSIEEMIRRGVRSRLLLSNRAISQYMRVVEARTLMAS